MEKIDLNIKGTSIHNKHITEDQEMQHRLESLFFYVLDALRGSWDVTTSANVLLTLIFYKRIIALHEEGELDFIQIDTADLELLQQLNQRIEQDRSATLQQLRYSLVNIARQNKALANIFAPLMQVLEHESDLQQLVQVLDMLKELDFSTSSFPIPAFGCFFNTSLNRSAARAGKSGGYWTTPAFINELLVRLLDPQADQVLYDPAAGQGSSLIEAIHYQPNLKIIAQEKNQNAWALCQMNLMMNGIYDADIRMENALLTQHIEPKTADIALSNFPFGMGIETRLVKNRPYLSIPFDVANTPEVDSNALFVQLMLHQLRDQGRMVTVLPHKVLFKGGDDRKLREFLLRRDWLEAVVTLPPGMLYSTGAPICIVVLNKNKTPIRENNVLFINASSLKVEGSSRMYRSLNATYIDEIVKAYKEYNTSQYPDLLEQIAIVPINKIEQNNYNLNAKQYAAPFIRELERLGKKGDLVPLGTVFQTDMPAVWVDISDNTLQDLPFVSKSDVALGFADYKLDISKLGVFRDKSEREGRFVNESVLIVNRVGARLRASYFNYQGQPILVSRQLMVFSVNEEQVIVEYLVLQLHTRLFNQQFQILRSDHENQLVSEGEFGHLQIVLPSHKKQDQEIRETKIQLLQAEEVKVEELRNRLNLDRQEAQSRQTRIISSLHHELGNRLPTILNEFKNLKDYLEEKAEEGTAISFEEPIFPIFEEEEDLGADALGQVIERIEQMLIYSISTIDAAGSIVSADQQRMQLEYLQLRPLLEEIASLYASEKQFFIQIEVEEDERGRELPIATFVDKSQLTTAITNLIENAKRHGFVNNKKYILRFTLGLSSDKSEVIIEVKNDGKPFPDSFTFNDFVGYGNYAGETGHSGIGGYLINQIMENHNGKLQYREQVDRNDPFKVQFELILPNLTSEI